MINNGSKWVKMELVSLLTRNADLSRPIKTLNQQSDRAGSSRRQTTLLSNARIQFIYERRPFLYCF